MTAPIDLEALDRDVARASVSLARWRARLEDEASREDASQQDPLAELRRVAGKTTYDELAALDPGPVEAPLRDGLARWVHALTEARVGLEAEASAAKIAHERVARVKLGSEIRASYREALRGLVMATGRDEARAWMGAAVDRGPFLAPELTERRARRFEVARRLGLSHPSALATATDPRTIQAGALAFLDATEALTASLLREAKKRCEHPNDDWRSEDTIVLAVASDAPEGWPAHLTTRWLLDLFGGLLHGRRLGALALPRPVGASSFARALGAFGEAYRVASAPRQIPFAIGHDPYRLHAHRFGFVFASLSTSRPFFRRALGTSVGVAEAQARVLARSGLLHARLLAVRCLLEENERAGAGEFEELSSRAFAAPLPRALIGAWPIPRACESSRFVALLTALPLVRDLEARFDDDWFKNPRVASHLASIACAPAFGDPTIDPVAMARALAAAFEEPLA